MKTFFITACLLVTSVVVCSQPDSIQAPYKRFPVFPPVRLLKTDSLSWFTKDDLPKKSSVMLMIFNPQCEHCKAETESIIEHINEFKKVQIVMAGLAPFDSIRAFYKKYELGRFENIVVGKDLHTFLPAYYDLRSLPFFAFYNRKKELITVFEGALSVTQMLKNLFE